MFVHRAGAGDARGKAAVKARRPACTWQEIVDHIWPEMDASGVSDQAVDSLVHRTRERLRAADLDRQLIVAIRGQGFRLDL